MKKAEQGTQAIRTGGRSVPLLSGSLFLVAVAQLVEEASDQLDAAGVPFDVQCRVLCGAPKEIAA